MDLKDFSRKELEKQNLVLIEKLDKLKKENSKLKEEIKGSPRNQIPPTNRINEPVISETPIDEILDSPDIDKELENIKLEISKYVVDQKSHDYYRTISNLMFKIIEAEGNKNSDLFHNGKWYRWYKLCKDYSTFYKNKEYSFKQKQTMDNWIKRKKIQIICT